MMDVNVDSNLSSQAVVQPSTNSARQCLTLVIRMAPTVSIDYRCEDKENVGKTTGYFGAIIYRSIDSFFWKTLIITLRKRTVYLEEAFEDIVLKPGFEIVQV